MVRFYRLFIVVGLIGMASAYMQYTFGNYGWAAQLAVVWGILVLYGLYLWRKTKRW